MTQISMLDRYGTYLSCADRYGTKLLATLERSAR